MGQYCTQEHNRILGKVKLQYWRTTHKFGIEIPHSVKQALEIDEHNHNNYWRNAIEKEMSKIISMGTFEEYRRQVQKTYRMEVFDIKMDGKFTHKARLVAGGHLT